MRYFLLLAACWLQLLSAAAAPLPADTAALSVTSLKRSGLLLRQGWRYQVGDNPQWARPGFDDSRWDTLNPTRPRPKLSPRLRTDISWLRLRFRLADSLRQRAVILQAYGFGAYEIYLNGQLLQRAGTVQVDPAQTAHHERPTPVELPAGGPPEQVLAIRFASWQSPLLHLSNTKHLLNVYLRSERQLRQRALTQEDNAIDTSLVAGAFGLLTLLHLAFFRYYPAQRANLYFAFFAGSMTLYTLVTFERLLPAFASPGPLLLLAFMARVLFPAAYLWAVRALYALFGFRPGWIHRGLWLMFGLVIAYDLYERDSSFYVTSLYYLLVFAFAEMLRLTGRALRRRQRGVWLAASGFAVLLLFLVAYLTFEAIGAWLKIPNLFGALLQGGWGRFTSLVLYLAPPLGVSLYLAREFALDSQLLQVKLSEVERLSAQTLAQEQEKQALLAAQNETLEQQVQQRTAELQRSLTDLRATQAQLIQKEKMASLGELTAGIAHEIQNPLNFVNNFAEVSAELLQELAEAQAAGDAAEVTALATDVRHNLVKITEHGRRAAGIVRGMLEHSRASTGERAPTDVNALCEEYLRLAYHGLRAQDHSFNATLETALAPGLPPVEAVGADLGRVLLNLLTNAFYAVRLRQQQGLAGYQPSVGVRTQVADGRVLVQVSDNGPGMPDEVKAKVFQPFFTTKPTGEGTGLGLSLSHDIIVQGHGGTLSVESQEGQGTTFTVGLPVTGAAG